MKEGRKELELKHPLVLRSLGTEHWRAIPRAVPLHQSVPWAGALQNKAHGHLQDAPLSAALPAPGCMTQLPRAQTLPGSKARCPAVPVPEVCLS